MPRASVAECRNSKDELESESSWTSEDNIRRKCCWFNASLDCEGVGYRNHLRRSKLLYFLPPCGPLSAVQQSAMAEENGSSEEFVDDDSGEDEQEEDEGSSASYGEEAQEVKHVG